MTNLFDNEEQFTLKVLELQRDQTVKIEYFSNLIQKIINKEKIFLVVNNKDLFELVNLIFIKVAESLEIGDPWKNSVDPLTFFLGASYSKSVSLESFKETEEIRQKEKSIGSKFGYFHQGLLRIAFKDLRPLEDIFKNAGNEFDVLSECGQIAIEVKSKWNTTKGDTRSDKYLNMWKMKKSSKQIYFAEIIWKPKKNNSSEDPIDIKKSDPIKFNDSQVIFYRCNGEYIYQQAANYNNLDCADVKILKTIFENFPFILWLYAKIYIKFFSEPNLESTNSSLNTCIKTAIEKYKSETNEERKKVWELIFNSGSEDGQLALFEDNSRFAAREKKQVRDLITKRNDLINLEATLGIVIDRIEGFFKSESDVNFFNSLLIGHLYEK